MSKNTKWKELGFASRAEYVGWLWFNGLTEDNRLRDDVYFEEFTGKVVNIMEELDRQESEQKEKQDPDAIIAEKEFGIGNEKDYI